MSLTLQPMTAGQLHAWLSLLKKTLVRLPFNLADYPLVGAIAQLSDPVSREIRRWAVRGQQAQTPPAAVRVQGFDWPDDAETMIGLVRLNNLHACAARVLASGVPGDFMETGVWRGGACIFLRALLAAYRDDRRRVWLADSFAGLPAPVHPADAGGTLHSYPELAISLETVQTAFARYGLLDDQVLFLPGWFRDTLPRAPVGRLALLRLDGDMYESTMSALAALYHRVSPGGFVIVDDYASIPACRLAVDEFRAVRGIAAPIVPIDWTGVYWQVEAAPPRSRRSGDRLETRCL